MTGLKLHAIKIYVMYIKHFRSVAFDGVFYS